MRKYFKIVLLIIISVFLVTGCASNNSPEDVAIEMVKRISNDNYEKIGDIFYQTDDTYFDDVAFEKIISDKQLNISGNSSWEVKEVGSEITDDDGNTRVTVKISIDDGKVFNVDTINVDGKWYVYDKTFYDGTLKIAVPDKATVYINGKKLPKKYLKSEKVKARVVHPDLSSIKAVALSDVEMNVYELNGVIKGKYDITVESDTTVKDVVYSKSDSYSISSNNYSYSTDGDAVTYVMNVAKDTEEIKTFVNDYLEKIYSLAMAKDNFDSVSKYFYKDSENFDTFKTNWNSLVKNLGDVKSTSRPDSYITDFKVKNIDYRKISYYNDENIGVAVSYDYSYGKHYRYNNESFNSDSDVSNSVDAILVLRKNGKSYAIFDGRSVFIK